MATKTKWNDDERRLAISEGWEIFIQDDGTFQLQKIDDPDVTGADWGVKVTRKFGSDRAAAKFVQEQANKGVAHALKAIRFLVERRSEDVKKFGLHLKK